MVMSAYLGVRPLTSCLAISKQLDLSKVWFLLL